MTDMPSYIDSARAQGSAAAAQPPSRSPDAADLALAKAVNRWLARGWHPFAGGDQTLAQALAAWLTARGIY